LTQCLTVTRAQSAKGELRPKPLKESTPIEICFLNYGGSCGKVVDNGIVKDSYKLEFLVDGKTHYMSFKDVLIVLPNSWFGKKAYAHQVCTMQSLVHDGVQLYIRLVIPETEPKL